VAPSYKVHLVVRFATILANSARSTRRRPISRAPKTRQRNPVFSRRRGDTGKAIVGSPDTLHLAQEGAGGMRSPPLWGGFTHVSRP